MANTALQSTQAPYSVGHNGPEGTNIGIATTDKVGFTASRRSFRALP